MKKSNAASRLWRFVGLSVIACGAYYLLDSAYLALRSGELSWLGVLKGAAFVGLGWHTYAAQSSK